jgi:hypothetical protein
MEGGGNKQNRHLLRSSASLPSLPTGAPGNIRAIPKLLEHSDKKAAIIYANALGGGMFYFVNLGDPL